ncbi:LuxR C-terminal-related transcriptional regulator [Treponema sp. R80B11-R83G3]
MGQYQPQIQWELTRALVSIAAWWVLFYRLHRPETQWRRIVLIITMPVAYIFWKVMPWGTITVIISWAAIIMVFAFICGDLRRTLFTALFYIGMEMSIDLTRSALSALIFNGFLPRYSPMRYLQLNLQYLVVFGLCCYYYTIMKRYSGKLSVASWVIIIIAPLIQFVVLTYFTYIADPLLEQQGINIYGPGFCFGLFCILLNLGILYLYIRQLIITDAQHLKIAVSNAEPIWTPENGLSDNFCKRYQLTDREKDIVEVMMRGKSNKEIADTLLISIRTVGAYLQNVYKKTGALNRFALYSLIKGE